MKAGGAIVRSRVALQAEVFDLEHGRIRKIGIMLERAGIREANGMTKLLRGAIDAALLGAVFFGAAGAAVQAETRAVIELFTSQGCSSCPAADKLLSELKNDPSLVTLSLPIDYWDYLGWKDTLASPDHTARQKAYSKMRGDREVYTPQVVVNGVMQALGSNRNDIEKAVTQSHQKAQALSVPVQLAFGDDRLTVTVPKANGEASAGEVWLCPVSRAVAVGIGRGENRGHTITYTNVVRRWIKLGAWTGKSESFSVPVDAIKSKGVDAVAVIVQGGSPDKPGLMLGASLAALH
jgi:hypothetical protein